MGMMKTPPMPAPQRSWCSLECYREDCWPNSEPGVFDASPAYLFCRRRLNALEGRKPKQNREEAVMRKTFKVVVAVLMGIFITSLGIANAGKLSKAVNSVINPEHEGVAKVEATDGNLADLEKLLGYELSFVLPRGQKMDYEIVKIKVSRSRFGKDAARSQRMFFFNLTNAPVEELIGGTFSRPFTCAITQKGSLIRFPRNMKVEDLKVVTVFSGKVLRVIELI